MPHSIRPAPREPSRAYDAAIVEYRTIRRAPRVVFDDLSRTAFEACSTLTDAIFTGCGRDSPRPGEAHVRCVLDPEGPGKYLLGFEVPQVEEPEEHRRALSRLLRPKTRRTIADPPDPILQGELLSATHIVEDLLLSVDLICSTPPGRLSVLGEDDEAGGAVEFVDGVRILRRTTMSTWGLLTRTEIQELLRLVLAPFQDPELYTMNVQEQTPYNSLGANWTITANDQLSRFVRGSRLEMPQLEPLMSADDLVR